MADEKRIDYDLRPEARAIRDAEAVVTAADILRVIAVVGGITAAGKVLHPKTGATVTVSAALAKALLNANGGGVPGARRDVVWSNRTFSYYIAQREVDALVVKGASMSLVNEINANIRVLSDRLMGAQISLEEWYIGMKREVKSLHMTQTALARGGFANMREQDWRRVEQLVAAHWNGVEGRFPGLRSFAEDIQNGRYGREVLSRQVLSRTALYGQAGRATYENERMAMRMEGGKAMLARRVRGFVDSCPDCIAWAELGWMPAEQMLADYPIGESVCGSNCYCIIEMEPA